nr:hypothetical protein [Tanacetum cinerariifolium]
MEDDVDINTLTMEQYLARVQDDIRPGVVKPKIGNDVEFEINRKFMRELRCKLFKGTDDEDAHEHVWGVLEIADLFPFPDVSHDKAFIWQYCPHFKTAKKLEEIRNFKHEVDEPLYRAWERYSDLLYRCPQHDLNSQQRVHIFYTKIYIPTCIMLDSKGFIPLMTQTQALKSIQVMVDHLRNWYDEATTKERIKVKNADRFRQILTPTIHILPNLKPMVQSYVTQGPVHDKEKAAREKEQDYDIPLQDHAKPDNDDVNIKFLSALHPSWSQVALTLKTRSDLEYLSFDDLYNKLRYLEIDVKGGSGYGSRGTTVAPIYSAFIGAVSTNTKMVYSDQPSHSSSITYTFAHSGSIMEDVLHSFIAENRPTQQLAYDDFEQVDQIEMEELDIKWQMAMLSLRINMFQKKAGRKINFNNKDPTRFDRRKARCYNCLQLEHFARECNVKKVDEKARYSAFNISEEKTKEPKAMHAGNDAGSVSDAAAEFAMMGISSKVQTCLFGCDSILSGLKKNYDHFEKLYNDSFIQVQAYKNTLNTLELQKDWYHKTQLALEEKVRILSANLENTTNTLKYTKTLYDQAKIEKNEWEVKLVESLARFDKWKESSKNLVKLINSSMSSRTKLGLGFKETIGSDEVFDLSKPSVFDPKPENKEVKSLYESDKSSESETSDFASCVSRPKTNDSSFTIDVKIFPNKNSSASITAGRSIPAASRNRPASIHVGRRIPAGRFNKPAPFPAGRSVPTGWTNHAARLFFRPTNLYFDNVFWPKIYNHISMNAGRWGSAVKSLA